MHSLKVYGLYFVQFLKARMSYRADFFAGLVANMIVGVTGLLFVVFLLDGDVITSLKGWSREEVLFIYGYSMMAMAIFSSIAINLYGFGDRFVIQGQFDRVLLRPLNSLCQVLFESFNIDSFGSMIVGVATMIYAAAELGITFGLFDIIWLLVSCVAGAAILVSVFVFLSSVSFHFEDRMGIAPPFYNLIAFGRYPLPIFNKLLQFLLSWVVPFAFVAFYPATHFFSRTGFETLCYFTPCMAVICLFVAWKAWQFGVANYASTGS
ncbi:MAG: ABC-2 family transporter protein [Bdellovibrionales bacterium]|nr:ABC-2 family transporter protein [Bdellovibrionales bacterium]